MNKAIFTCIFAKTLKPSRVIKTSREDLYYFPTPLETSVENGIVAMAIHLMHGTAQYPTISSSPETQLEPNNSDIVIAMLAQQERIIRYLVAQYKPNLSKLTLSVVETDEGKLEFQAFHYPENEIKPTTNPFKLVLKQIIERVHPGNDIELMTYHHNAYNVSVHYKATSKFDPSAMFTDKRVIAISEILEQQVINHP